MNMTGLNFKNGLKNGAFILFSLFLLLSLSNSYVHAEWADVTPPNISTNWELFDVKFVSANEGWAVGYGILHYNNK